MARGELGRRVARSSLKISLLHVASRALLIARLCRQTGKRLQRRCRYISYISAGFGAFAGATRTGKVCCGSLGCFHWAVCLHPAHGRLIEEKRCPIPVSDS